MVTRGPALPEGCSSRTITWHLHWQGWERCALCWLDGGEILNLSGDLLVSIGNSNPCHGSRVASQEQERHVASCGHQVHQHGHPDGSQSREAELLHQEATQEYAQTRTWDCCHPCKRKKNSYQQVEVRVSEPHCYRLVFLSRQICVLSLGNLLMVNYRSWYSFTQACSS